MKKLSLLLIGLLLSACGTSRAPLLATGPRPVPAAIQSVAGIRREMVVMAGRQLVLQDADKNGVVSRSEWYGWDRDFDLADTDNDNKVTLAEYRALMVSPLSVETFQSIMRRELQTLDTDGNGRVSGAEWQANTHAFSDKVVLGTLPWRPFDKDRDSALNGSEFEDAFAHYWARHD